MKNSHKIFAKIFIFLFALMSLPAQKKDFLNVQIDQIIYKDYPEITAYAVIKNNKGELVSGLAPTLFSFRVDSADAKIKSKIIPFSMADEKVNYTILMSNNGIMEGEPLDFQKNAILKFVELMNDEDTLSVYTVGEEAGAIFENVNRKQFDSSLINKIEISNNQPRLYDSIINLIRKVEQKSDKRKIVIILSDGRDQNSRFSKTQVLDVLDNSGIPIYSVGIRILSNQTLSNLDEFAQFTGGSYYYSQRISDVPEKIKNIIECVKQSYILKLKIKSHKSDNQVHILEVKIDERDSEGKGFKKFVATKHPIPKWFIILWIVIAGLLVIIFIVLIIITKISKRKAMGITKRRCPDCGYIMKDYWESCPFCKYMPELKRKKKNK